MTAALLERFVDALFARHLAELTFSEVRKSLQALSSLYVERREKLPEGAVFDGRGKRAAFAVFYGPLHFETARLVAGGLGRASTKRIVDLGCGTGAAGAGLALAVPSPAPRITGVERSSWAAQEARFTYETLGVNGRARSGDLFAEKLPGSGETVLLGWVVNELTTELRAKLLPTLFACGAELLVVEPIATRLLPWWSEWREAFEGRGGRADEWRFPAVLPDRLKELDHAAGLRHDELTARSLYLPSRTTSG